MVRINTGVNGGGMPDVLEPVNAREIIRVRRGRWSAFMYLALTTSNKESLVLMSRGVGGEAPVLFTADSDLSFSQTIPWRQRMIITAPHHGSDANSFAYGRFERETGRSFPAVWVRSDGRFFRSRPGKSYLRAYGDRFCTLCRGSSYGKQDVRLRVGSRGWQPESTRKCCCV